jgi:ATP-dependent Lon protease
VPLVDRVVGELILAQRMGQAYFRTAPLILAGRSGVGKSRFARRLMHHAGAAGTEISAAGSADNRALAGTARGWGTAQPCLPLIIMRSHGVANPVVVVEEVDKTSSSRYNGRLTDTLLLMIDRITCKRYFDDCLLVPADLSAVSWIMTANDTEKIDPLLRSRCTVLSMPGPRPEDFPVILSSIVQDIADEFGVSANDLPTVPAEAIDAIRKGFEGRALQVRQLTTLYRQALIVAARAEREQRQ